MLLQTICAVSTAVVIGLMMTGCSSDKNSSAADTVSSSVSSSETATQEGKTAKDILSEIDNENLDGKAFYGDETFSENCKKLYGADESAFSDGGIIYATGGGLADEVSMLKTKDGKSAENYLTSRLEARKTTFKNYKPEESDKLDNAEIFHSGDWWVLVISDKSDEISSKIKSLTVK